MNRWGFWILSLLAAIVARADDESAALQAFTGARTKLAWIQQVEGPADDAFCWTDRHILRVLDTAESTGARTLVGEIGSFHRPLITPRGDRVVFSRFSTRKFYVVNWDGNGLREVGDGCALAVWRDPATSEEWVYFAQSDGEKEWDQHFCHDVRRVKLDDPRTVEPVWDRTTITINNFQLSADGTRACSQFPHPRAGFARLPNQDWTPITPGCWTSMSPDNSYWLWVFDGKHRNITLHDPTRDRSWTVHINTAPGMDGYEVYHPRWSNDKRFIVLTGPYKTGEKGKNLICWGGRNVEILVGRFNRNCTRIAEWLQATHNDLGDFYPDLWLEKSGDEEPPAAREPATDTDPVMPETWPLVRQNLIFVWDNALQPDELTRPDGAKIPHGPLTGHGRAVWGPHHEMALSGGRFMAWDDGRILQALRYHRAVTIEALVTPARDSLPFPTPLLGYTLADGTPLFGIEQEGNTLNMLATFNDQPTRRWTIGPVAARLTAHVVVTFEGGRLRAWLDGRQTLDESFELVSLNPGGLGLLRFGGDAADRSWPGQLESVALYDGALAPEDVQRHWAWQSARLAGRPPLTTVHVKARLIEAPPAPEPASIAPYRRALSAQVYEIECVLEGHAATGRVVVAGWSVLDGHKVESAREPDRTYELDLEPFEEHPQLESERLLMDSRLLTLPLYYESMPR